MHRDDHRSVAIGGTPHSARKSRRVTSALVEFVAAELNGRLVFAATPLVVAGILRRALRRANHVCLYFFSSTTWILWDLNVATSCA